MEEYKPQILLLPITYHCNSRCIMCTIWEREGPNIDEEVVQSILLDPFMTEHLERLGLTGGEPTLNREMVSILEKFIEKCPNLKEVTFNTHGFHSEKVKRFTIEMAELLIPHNIKLGIIISLDGIGKAHDIVRGISGVYKKTLQTIEVCQELSRQYSNLELSVNSTITSQNTEAVQDLLKFSMDRGVPVNYSLVMNTSVGINSAASSSNFEIEPHQRPKLTKFFKRLKRVSSFQDKNSLQAQYYDHIVKMLNGEDRVLSCPFQGGGCLIEPNGDVYPCGKTDELLMGNLKENTFTEIWNSDRAKAVWKELPSHCQTCESNCFVNAIDQSVQQKWLLEQQFSDLENSLNAT